MNTILLEDGSIARRGGTANLSTAALDTSLRGIWDGFLLPGQRTFLASADNYGVLDGSEGVVNLGGAGTSAPKRGAELAGLLFFNDSLYGGSRKTSQWSTGTVSVTAGSKTVTGAGSPAWSTNADAGMLLRVAGTGRVYPVASVDSNTQLTLRDAYQGSTAAGQAYVLYPIFTASSPYRTGLWLTAGSRMWSLENSFAYFSNFDNPSIWDTNDNLEMPEGAQLLGGVGLAGRALLFSTAGLHVVTGIELDLVDAYGNVQMRNDHFTRDLVLWDHNGIATWQGEAVVPCTDDLWLVSGAGPSQRLSKSITPLYREYVQAGYQLGVAEVHEGHYVLPVLNSSHAWVDTLVVRLDRAVDSPLGTSFGFTRFNGSGAQVSGYAVRTGASGSAREPKLLGASLATTARVLDCSEYFKVETTEEDDADGSDYEWTIDTRDYATGSGRAKSENTVRRVYVRYELDSADTATIAAFFGDGTTDLTGIALYDTAIYDTDVYAEDDAGEWDALEGVGPEDTGRVPMWWAVNRRIRFARFRFRVSAAASKMVVRSVEMKVRLTGKD